MERHILLVTALQTLLVLVWNTKLHIAIYVTKVKSFYSHCVVRYNSLEAQSSTSFDIILAYAEKILLLLH